MEDLTLFFPKRNGLSMFLKLYDIAAQRPISRLGALWNA